jgi:hypothetical protein
MTIQDRISRKRFLTTLSQGAGAMALGGLMKPSNASDLQLPYRLKQVGLIQAPYERIRDLAFDPQSRLLVGGGMGVRILTAEGHPEKEIATPSAVQSVTTDPEGALFVGLRKEVLSLDPTGKKRASWAVIDGNTNGFGFVTCLSFFEDKVFIADAGNRSVYRFASDGDYIDAIDGFHIPSAYFDCAVDSKGMLHVAHTSEHRVESYNPNGELVEKWGKYGSSPADFCGCCNPTNLSLMPNGWMVTSEKGIPRLKVHDSNGTLQAILSPEELGLKEEQSYLSQIRQANADSLPCHDGWPGMPVAIDKRGRLAVSLPGLNQIRLYEIAPV